QVLRSAFPWCAHWEDELRKLFAGYTAAKQAQNVLDYDDLLLYWAQAAGDPALAREMGSRFDHVLVDEYQDTNRLQAQILLALKPDGRGVTVVGDDAQSIYSFRAATVRNILDFPAQFPQPARVVTLDRNYRSTQPILDASNAVIGLAPATATRLLDTMAASAEPIVAMQAFVMTPAVAEEWAQFLRVFLSLRGAESPWPAELELVARWYEPHLQRIHEDAFVRQRDIAQLQQIAATYPSRERFLTELALDPPAATSDEAGTPGRDDDYLILSTIHSAKGQEWKTVHILNVVDGCIP